MTQPVRRLLGSAATIVALLGAGAGCGYVTGFTVLQESVSDDMRGRDQNHREVGRLKRHRAEPDKAVGVLPHNTRDLVVEEAGVARHIARLRKGPPARPARTATTTTARASAAAAGSIAVAQAYASLRQAE